MDETGDGSPAPSGRSGDARDRGRHHRCHTARARGARTRSCTAAVAEHLFAVASGLESVVVGEGEIAGQVRRALTEARRRPHHLPRTRAPLPAGDRGAARRQDATPLGRTGRSLVSLALDLADSRVADWAAATRVVMVGTGPYAAATLAALRDRGATDVQVRSPSGRAAQFAAKPRLRAVGCRELRRIRRRGRPRRDLHEFRGRVLDRRCSLLVERARVNRRPPFLFLAPTSPPLRVSAADHRPRHAPQRRPRTSSACPASPCST